MKWIKRIWQKFIKYASSPMSEYYCKYCNRCTISIEHVCLEHDLKNRICDLKDRIKEEFSE